MLSGYSLKVSGANTATEMDRGSPRRRRTATKSKTILDFSIALTETQFAIFAAWWRYDLNDGTLPATMKILNGYADDPMPVQFLKPYTATDMVGKWYVSCQGEIDPPRLSAADLSFLVVFTPSQFNDFILSIGSLHYLVHTSLVQRFLP